MLQWANMKNLTRAIPNDCHGPSISIESIFRARARSGSTGIIMVLWVKGVLWLDSVEIVSFCDLFSSDPDRVKAIRRAVVEHAFSFSPLELELFPSYHPKTGFLYTFSRPEFPGLYLAVCPTKKKDTCVNGTHVFAKLNWVLSLSFLLVNLAFSLSKYSSLSSFKRTLGVWNSLFPCFLRDFLLVWLMSISAGYVCFSKKFFPSIRFSFTFSLCFWFLYVFFFLVVGDNKSWIVLTEKIISWIVCVIRLALEWGSLFLSPSLSPSICLFSYSSKCEPKFMYSIAWSFLGLLRNKDLEYLEILMQCLVLHCFMFSFVPV